jgi:YVTN family beta-propeller protein
MKSVTVQSSVLVAALCAGSLFNSAYAQGDADEPTAQAIPNTGQLLTPTAPAGSRFESLNPNLTSYPAYTAGQAVITVESPDRKTLLILTSGYNLWNYPSGSKAGQTDPTASNEYVFVYDISNKIPVKKQVLQVPNTYNGIVFDPSGTTFYVSGGVDDAVHIFDLTAGAWAERAGSPIALGHNNTGVGLQVQPAAAGIAITADGTKLVVTDYYNDAISILTKTNGAWAKTGELDLRPGKINPTNSGVPGGEYPFWAAIKGSSTVYVSSLRDREIDVIDIATLSVLTRIKVTGQPNKMTLNADQSKLYVAEDETDTVDVIDTTMNSVTASISVGAPAGLLTANRTKYTGNNTNSVSLSPDEKSLYVTNGNMNDVAVVDLSASPAQVVGLIPTGWYPTSVSTSADGTYMYVVNYKSVTGPNPQYCQGGTGIPTAQSTACDASNSYDLQLIKAGFQSFPTPSSGELHQLTNIVAANNHFSRAPTSSEKAEIAFLRSNIKHVIFIIKENRTYDQILGDLPAGNGDPDITQFGQSTTPNLHALASNFVDLDNFYDRSEVSMDGWPWTTSARAPDVVERQVTVNYAGRGLTNDSEGTNRNVNVSYAALADRLTANPLTLNDPDVLPGTVDTAAPDSVNHEVNNGYIWNAALKAGLSIRDYGFFIDLARYNLPSAYSAFNIPELEMPFNTKTQVAYSTSVTLRPYTDIYFRGFDNSFPDYWRYQEWAREFDTNYAAGGLPNLEFVRLMHDHTGNFSTAIDGVNTVELQEADNDYAVGLVVQKISNSIYKNNTLIFVIEDDSQAGGDHVDTHRSIAFIVGPYVKQHQVISTAYNTVDFVRTIEEILGIKPLNLNDALATPMLDVFQETLEPWSYKAVPSALLANTTLPIPSSEFAGLKPMTPTHDAAYWTQATKGMDFSAEDRIDFAKYNHILWKGIMGSKPYPEKPSGLDLRQNRSELLKHHEQQTSGSGGL